MYFKEEIRMDYGEPMTWEVLFLNKIEIDDIVNVVISSEVMF